MTTPTLEALSVSGADRWQLARATVSFQALLAWDHAWTGAAESVEPLDGDGARLLPILAAELQRGLGEAHEGAAWLHDFVLTTGSERLARLIAAQAVVAREDAQLEFAELLEEFGGDIGALAESGYNGFMANEAAEQKSLSEKLTSLMRGGNGGDLSIRIRCNLADLTIVAGLVSAVVPPHAHAVGIIAAGAPREQLGSVSNWINLKQKEESVFKKYR